VEETEQVITFNRDTCRWEVLGDAETVRRSQTRNQIPAVLNTVESMAPKEAQMGQEQKPPLADP
jgi:hypothetical protein